MGIKDLYIYAWTHCQVELDTGDSDYPLCFILNEIQHKSTKVLGMLQVAIDRKSLARIINMLAIRIKLEDMLPTDWLDEHLIPDNPASLRHLQTELDQLIQEPERTCPEFYNIPAWLCHPAVFDKTSGPLSDFPIPSQPWYIRCVRRTSCQPLYTVSDEPTSVTQESDSASVAD